jgi:hypothetical protein
MESNVCGFGYDKGRGNIPKWTARTFPEAKPQQGNKSAVHKGGQHEAVLGSLKSMETRVLN